MLLSLCLDDRLRRPVEDDERIVRVATLWHSLSA
jgi:hypothetical protein